MEEQQIVAVQMRDGSEPSAMAHEAVHETAALIMSSLPSGRLLDVPAGEGALASRLLRLGFDVHCCDLYPQIFKLPGVEIRLGDLSISLPYDDAEFDYVTCIEGLEHIENQHQAIREFRRVLKPGGHLIVSIPNILNIEERLKWVINGYTSHFKPLSKQALEPVFEEYAGIQEVALHINPIGYSELRYILENNGFAIVKVHRDKPKSRGWLYWPFIQIIRVANRFQSPARRRERWSDELQSDEVLNGGNTLILHAQLGQAGKSMVKR